MAEPEAAPTKTFTEEQIAKYKLIFNIFDISKNGKISAKELTAVSKALGYRQGKEKLQAIIDKFNLGDDGVLTFETFLEAMPGNSGIPEDEHRKAEFRRAFQVYDSDGTGYVTKENAFIILNKELGFSEDKTWALMTQCDIDADGKLCYEEFVRFYAKVEEKKKEMQKMFDEFDIDKKGYLSEEDAKRILGDFGLSDEDVIPLVKAHARKEEGKLFYEDFVQFWGIGI